MLRFQIILSGNIGDSAVGGHHNTDGAVSVHDLFRPQLCCFRHWDFMIIPWGGHHSGDTFLLSPHRATHHVANGIDHTNTQLCRSVRRNFHRFLRYELRLGSHDGLTAAALGQFVTGSLLAIWVFNAGNDQFFHDSLDQGGFSGSHRPHNTDVDITAGSCGNVLINAFHSQPPNPAGGWLLPLVTPWYVQGQANRTPKDSHPDLYMGTSVPSRFLFCGYWTYGN